jgi:hypothetical protein
MFTSLLLIGWDSDMDGPDDLLPADAATRDLVIAVDGLAALPAVLRRVAPGRRFVVVADDNTSPLCWRATGSPL